MCALDLPVSPLSIGGSGDGASRGVAQGEIQTDLDFIREALITTEVNIARVFNHDVKTRREAKVGAGCGSMLLLLAFCLGAVHKRLRSGVCLCGRVRCVLCAWPHFGSCMCCPLCSSVPLLWHSSCPYTPSFPLLPHPRCMEAGR
jgi:hypothetical protein